MVSAENRAVAGTYVAVKDLAEKFVQIEDLG